MQGKRKADDMLLPAPPVQAHLAPVTSDLAELATAENVTPPAASSETLAPSVPDTASITAPAPASVALTPAVAEVPSTHPTSTAVEITPAPVGQGEDAPASIPADDGAAAPSPAPAPAPLAPLILEPAQFAIATPKVEKPEELGRGKRIKKRVSDAIWGLVAF